MLQARGLAKSFGGLRAVDDIDLQIEAGTLFGIIGPNGSGKTTLFNLLTGYLAPSSGQVWFENREITNLAPEAIVRAGISRTFQAVRFHKESTVRETVWAAQSINLPTRALFRSMYAKSEDDSRAEVDRILEKTWLTPHADRLARELPFGLVRQLEIARSLATRPRLLLMDEPASGMNPAETTQLAKDIRRLNESGIAVVLIEHDIDMVMSVCDRIAVLSFGKKIAEGTAQEIKRDPNVISAYLGAKHAAHA